MANYESVTRSNYFHVKDEDAFSKFMDTVSGDDMHCWSDKDEDGNTLHAFGCDGSIYGVPNGAEDNDFDLFLSELQKHIAPEDAVILMQSGHEKLRYVTGFAMHFIRTSAHIIKIWKISFLTGAVLDIPEQKQEN